MKYVILIIILILVVGVLSFNWLVKWSPEAKQCLINVKNSEKLHVGMNLSDALVIMGKPNNIQYATFDSKIRVYYYKPPFMASSGIRFEVDTNYKLISIERFE